MATYKTQVITYDPAGNVISREGGPGGVVSWPKARTIRRFGGLGFGQSASTNSIRKKKKTLRTVNTGGRRMRRPMTPEMEGPLKTYAEKTYGTKLKEGWRERLRGVR